MRAKRNGEKYIPERASDPKQLLVRVLQNNFCANLYSSFYLPSKDESVYASHLISYWMQEMCVNFCSVYECIKRCVKLVLFSKENHLGMCRTNSCDGIQARVKKYRKRRWDYSDRKFKHKILAILFCI
jgi:hypothetical protein